MLLQETCFMVTQITMHLPVTAVPEYNMLLLVIKGECATVRHASYLSSSENVPQCDMRLTCYQAKMCHSATCVLLVIKRKCATVRHASYLSSSENVPQCDIRMISVSVVNVPLSSAQARTIRLSPLSSVNALNTLNKQRILINIHTLDLYRSYL